MPLVVNGTTIPQNVANALMVNGVSVKQVIANGVTVWSLALGPTVGWSGDSIETNVYNQGLDTSGFLFRACNFAQYGAWNTANGDGTFTGTSICPNLGYYSSGNTIGLGSYSTGVVTYASSNKSFTGGSQGTGTTQGLNSSGIFRLETSGGLLRHRSTLNTGVTPSWISLT
jgi:hypothetical protein